MVTIQNNQVFSTENKFIHRVGSDTYFKRGTILPTDTIDSYEEVDEVPKYSKDDYNRKVEELIALKYSNGQEIQFAREKELAGEAYTEYLEYIEECKVKAKQLLKSENESEPLI